MENKTSFHKFMDATSGVKVELAASDKLEGQFEKLIQLEKQTASDIATLKKQIEQSLQKLMIAADGVLFEYGNLKDDVIALVGEAGAKSWASANNGMENYADKVQQAVSTLYKKLDQVKYIG
jgi:hypothetical protein